MPTNLSYAIAAGQYLSIKIVPLDTIHFLCQLFKGFIISRLRGFLDGM